MKTAHGAVHGGRHFRTSLSDWRASGSSDRTPYGRRGWAESDAARRRFRGDDAYAEAMA